MQLERRSTCHGNALNILPLAHTMHSYSPPTPSQAVSSGPGPAGVLVQLNDTSCVMSLSADVHHTRLGRGGIPLSC